MCKGEVIKIGNIDVESKKRNACTKEKTRNFVEYPMDITKSTILYPILKITEVPK